MKCFKKSKNHLLNFFLFIHFTLCPGSKFIILFIANEIFEAKLLILNEMFQKTESITPHIKINARNLKEEITKRESFEFSFKLITKS